jgi:hypothetical protein
MKSSTNDVPTTAGGNTFTADTYGGVMGATGDDVGIVTGLLPNVWGMTLAAPTANGLDISARLGLYTHMQGGQNSLGNGLVNIRETSGSVSGFFGTVLVGRSLGIHQSNAILNDMLLFGVGASSTSDNTGTTLGRIGLGYLYTDFQAQISWTLPDLGYGFNAKIGIFDPNDVTADTAAVSATEGSSPRVEAQVTWNGSIFNTGIGANFWIDGSYQNTERTTAQARTMSNRNIAGNANGMDTSVDQETDVESAGVGFGTKLTYEGFALVATGFYGNAMGIRGQHTLGASTSVGALDDGGTERKSYGGYIQGTFDFGQGTSVGYSYGGNYLQRTGSDMNNLGTMNYQTMHSGMIWHNVTDNFRLIAEGGYTEKAWYLADHDQEDTFGGVGAFFFW